MSNYLYGPKCIFTLKTETSLVEMHVTSLTLPLFHQKLRENLEKKLYMILARMPSFLVYTRHVASL